jgi:Flp pilus assembly protein TadD, contains TPR repeats
VQLWRRQGEAAIAAGWRAVSLDPNNADAHLFLAFALVSLGRGEEALHYIAKGIRLNPHPSAVYQLVLGLCYFVMEDYEKAISVFKRGIQVTAVFKPNHFNLCLTYAQLGRDEELRVAREKLLELTESRTSVVQSFWLNEEMRLRMRSLGQLAGFEPLSG